MLGFAGIVLMVVYYRLAAIGVRGGSVSRLEWPVVYWFAMGVLALVTVMSFFVAIWTSV